MDGKGVMIFLLLSVGIAGHINRDIMVKNKCWLQLIADDGINMPVISHHFSFIIIFFKSVYFFIYLLMPQKYCKDVFHSSDMLSLQSLY